MTRFEQDTAVEVLGPLRLRATIDEGWWIERGPNGGYMAAIALRAAIATVGDARRAPRSFTLHFSAPPRAGELEIVTAVEREGRSLSTVSGRMQQEGRLVALFLAALSRGRDTYDRQDLARPEAPPPEECLEIERPTPLGQRYDYRWLPGAQPDAGSGRALTAGWIRPREAQPLEASLVAAYTDAFPPALFAVHEDHAHLGGLPTIDLNVHFHGEVPPQDSDDFCLGVFRSDVGRDGFVAEDGEVWSRDGRLLAQSRQLAVVTGTGH